MRILDENTDKSLENITLYLTLSEAMELRGSLNELIENPKNNHTHINDENYQKELTVCIYSTEDLNGFNTRSIDLILNNK